MTRRLVNQTAALNVLAIELKRRLPAALAHAKAIAADGYPGGGGSDFNVRAKNEISDPTANAALSRTTGSGSGYALADQIQRLEQCIAIAATELGEALGIVDRLMPPPGASPRCSGGHLPGAHLARSDGGWHEPCWNVPDGRPGRLGLCDKCYQRYERWRNVPRTADVA